MVSTDLTAIEATRGRRGVARDLLGALFVAGARTALTFLAVGVEPGAFAFRAYALVAVAFLRCGAVTERLAHQRVSLAHQATGLAVDGARGAFCRRRIGI